MTVPFATADVLAGTRHGFCGRRGGVSAGIFASLNTGLGSSDAPGAVAENRRRAAAAVAPGTRLVTVHQIHSATVIVADATMADGPSAARAPADGLVTDRPGLVLGVLAADCAPVLFADARAGVVGAAHAGWKGALYGVLPATVAAMETLGARRAEIAAAIGPCIAPESYEVRDAYVEPFLATDPAFARFFRAGRGGHRRFDLPGFVARQLETAGVTRIETLARDTYTGDYFSYRRSVHAGDADYGRNLSLIALA